MPREELIQWFVIGVLGVTGLSHIVQPRLWSEFFIELLQKRYAGLVIGAPTLLLGLPVALGHWRWELEFPVIVTIIGCAWTTKGTLYLLCPQLLQRVGQRHVARPQRFTIAGTFILAIVAVLVADQLMPKLAPVEG